MTEPCTVTGVLRDAAGDLLTSTKLSFRRAAMLQAIEGATVVAPVFGTAAAAAEVVTTDGTTGAFSVELMPGVYRLSYQGGAGIETISFAVPIADTRDLAVLIGQATTIDSTLIQTVLEAAALIQDLDKRVPINAVAVSRSIVSADAGAMIEVDAVASVTLTVPTDAAAEMPVGTVLQVAAFGNGGVSIAAAAGVVIRSTNLARGLPRYGIATLIKRAPDDWYLFGDLI